MKQIQSLTLLTQNQKVKEILQKIQQVVDSDSSILLIGETGVGKELFAEYVHNTSPRAQRPFVKIGLSALPADLLESELFGHERGAYTSAMNEKKGLFEIANTGSIFLDDIDDVPLSIQTKLLRVLESRELMRIGGTAPIPIDVRLITASKVDLKLLVERGIFRADLFYRINVVPINIPPLRDRTDDIPLLIEHFFKKFSPDKEISVSTPALRALLNYSWPGNIRELKNVIQRISLFAEKEIMIDDLPQEIKTGDPIDFLLKACNKCFLEYSMSLNQIVQCLENNLINAALSKTNGNQSQAAKKLGLSLSTFRDKLKKYNLIKGKT